MLIERFRHLQAPIGTRQVGAGRLAVAVTKRLPGRFAADE